MVCHDWSVSRADRLRRRIERKEAKGYTAAFGHELNVPVVDGDQWVGQEEAAARLGVSGLRVGWLLSSGRLGMAHDIGGRAGVTRSSVEAEFRRRSGAGPFRRLCILGDDLLRGLVRGI
jgi:hypothetical protein